MRKREMSPETMEKRLHEGFRVWAIAKEADRSQEHVRSVLLERGISPALLLPRWHYKPKEQ